MTVVLLDPSRPDLIPIRARTLLSGRVMVTEDVSAATLWEFDHVEPAVDAPPGSDGSDAVAVLVSTDPAHPLVRTRIARGEEVIAAERVSGAVLLEAVALMDTLRRNGPWESQQTHASLRRYLLEEVYELLDAIELDNPDELREELGDLLLQVLFHARIAADDPDTPFDIDDVARSFTQKVTGRTPGVLSGAHSDLETQIREWEERKAAEKQRGSVLDGIATTAPALALTQKVLERLTAAAYPVETIDPQVLTITVTADGDSVEDTARRRVLALIDQVRAAEERAKSADVTLDTADAWHGVLVDVSRED
ncbi:MazG family protein [Gordonia sp. NPDC003585]|uniref:MazG family protein n=1 Tax=Gordonia sp. NPDC003585 TaxID=3154275 RepID=UPI0033AA7B2A